MNEESVQLFAVLKLIHILALTFGAAASLGNVYLMLSAGPHDLAAPGFTNQLRKFFRFTALAAICLFWASGILIMFWQYGIWIEGFAFNAKIALVAVLSVSVILLNFMAPIWARRGGPPAWVSSLHWINAILFLAIVVLAVVAFS